VNIGFFTIKCYNRKSGGGFLGKNLLVRKQNTLYFKFLLSTNLIYILGVLMSIPAQKGESRLLILLIMYAIIMGLSLLTYFLVKNQNRKLLFFGLISALMYIGINVVSPEFVGTSSSFVLISLMLINFLALKYSNIYILLFIATVSYVYYLKQYGVTTITISMGYYINRFINLVILFFLLLYGVKLFKSYQSTIISQIEELEITNKRLNEANIDIVNKTERIKQVNKRFEVLLNGTKDGVFDYNVKTKEIYASDTLKNMLKVTNENIKDMLKKPSKYIFSDENKDISGMIDDFMMQKQYMFLEEVRVLLPNKSYHYVYLFLTYIADKNNDKTRLIGLVRDIHKERVYKEKIYKLAYHDTLTNLTNRIYYVESLSEYILKKDIEAFDIIIFNIDNFKAINDVYSYDFGDLVLRHISDEIKKLSEYYITFSRLSSDEFAIIVKEGLEGVTLVEKIQKLMKEPQVIRDTQILVTLSFGIARQLKTSNNIHTLLNQVESALLKAKSDGKNCYSVFNKDMSNDLYHHLLVTNIMEKALDNNEFFVNYQPIIDSKTSKVIAIEVLARWKNEKLGYIPPNIFIEVAEKRGLIIRLSKVIMENSLVFLEKLNELGYPIIMSINLSTVQLRRDDFTKNIKAILKNRKFEYSQIQLEITENAIIDGIDLVIPKLNELKKLGVKVALDDFGTGYSSLNYLRQLPIDVLKIDKSFIDELSSNRKNSEYLLDSIIKLAKGLDLDVVAEGVETKVQLKQLTELDYVQIQGYIFSKPLNEEDLIKYLQNNY